MKRATAKSPPLTPEDMRRLHREGWPFMYVADMAYRRNGLPRSQVRSIVFGDGR